MISVNGKIEVLGKVKYVYNLGRNNFHTIAEAVKKIKNRWLNTIIAYVFGREPNFQNMTASTIGWGNWHPAWTTLYREMFCSLCSGGKKMQMR